MLKENFLKSGKFGRKVPRSDRFAAEYPIILLLNGNRQLKNNEPIHFVKLSIILIPKTERDEKENY